VATHSRVKPEHGGPEHGERWLDWFVPPALRQDPDTHVRARVFVVAHLVGPLIPLAIAAALHFVAGVTTPALLALTLAYATFMTFPFILRRLTRLESISRCSVVPTAVLTIVAIYCFGGPSSFLLPWVAAIPVVGMFYLGREGLLVTGAIELVGLAGLAALDLAGHTFPQPVPDEWVNAAYLFSTALAVLLATGMALAFVSVYDLARRRLRLEVRRHRRTAADHRAALETATQASTAKTRFLANMSHELRTPLNAIIGFSQMIVSQLYGPVGDARYREYAQDIQDSGNHLLHIINGILDLAQIESGRIELKETVTDLREIVAQATALHAPLVQHAELKLTEVLPAGPVMMRIDDLRIKQAVVNLLANAVKFTPAGGEVTVSIGIGPTGEVRLSITDTGIGIAKQDIPLALEPFRQVGDRHDAANNGAGLGLALTRQFIDLHGGRIEIDSVLGQGTTVTLHLPAKRHLGGPRDQQDIA